MYQLQNLKERGHMEHLDVEEWTDFRETGYEVMDLINLV
jgi:hypothetical protein